LNALNWFIRICGKSDPLSGEVTESGLIRLDAVKLSGFESAKIIIQSLKSKIKSISGNTTEYKTR